MNNELNATRFSYMTVGSALQLMGLILLILNVIIFVNLIIFAVHRRKKVKKGHGPFSDWYVIVPHLICILMFMLLTQYLTFFMFTIGKARAVSASLTMLFVFLLSLRGLIRRKNKRGIVTTLATAALVPLAYQYHNMLAIDSFSYVHMAIYFTIVIILTIAAVKTFRSDTQPGSDSEEDGGQKSAPGPDTEASPA